MNKGFTLIELLSIIVVLAIVSLIAIPTMSNVITKSKRSSAVLGAESYTHAVEVKSISNDLKGYGSISNGIYEISSLDVNAKGKAPKSGIVVIEQGKVKNAKLCINDFSVDVINGKASISDNNYCNNDNITVAVNNQGTSIGSSKSSFKKFTIDTENNSVVSCSNGAIPLVSGNTLVVIPNGQNAFCDVNTSISKAIKIADKTRFTVEVFKDHEESDRWYINDYKDIVVNLHNHKYKYNSTDYKYMAYVYGKLEINGTDNSELVSTQSILSITSPGQVVINNGNYISTNDDENATSSTAFLNTSGSLIINNSNAKTTGDAVLYNKSDYAITSINDSDLYSEKNILLSILGGKTEINNCNLTSETNHGSSTSSTGQLVINKSNVKAYLTGSVAYGTNGKVTINDSKYHTVKNAAIQANNGEMTINNTDASSEKSHALAMFGDTKTKFTVNGGGTFTTITSNVIYATGSGTFTINQSKNPIHIRSQSNDVQNTINVGLEATGKLIINAKKADKCTSNPKDTKEGLCAYAVQDENVTVKKNLFYNPKGSININGGTYKASNSIFAINTGLVNIKNAELISENVGIANTAGKVFICSSSIKAVTYEFYGESGSEFSYKNLESMVHNPPKYPSAVTVNSNYAGSCEEVLAE